MKDFQVVINYISESNALDVVGAYGLEKHGTELMFNGKAHPYFNSGLCREVYISPCKTYVVKVPIQDEFETNLKEYLKTGRSYLLSVAASHNLFEAKCYKDAPKEYRKFLAKTELLPHFWVKQEFVDVRRVVGSNTREIGVKNGKCVIFDYDVMFSGFQEPINGFRYEKLPKIISDCERIIGINQSK